MTFPAASHFGRGEVEPRVRPSG